MEGPSPTTPTLRTGLAAAALALDASAPARARSLSAPYMSRALDAVLLPVDDGARVALDL